MIGNAPTARMALTDPYVTLFSDEGCARNVYLIDNVIYKVDKEYGANVAEWNAYKRLSTIYLPPFIRIPRMTRYDFGEETVIAAEYVSGVATGECFGKMVGLECDCSDPCLSTKAYDAVTNYIEDTSWGNVIVSDGIYYIVDLEC